MVIQARTFRFGSSQVCLLSTNIVSCFMIYSAIYSQSKLLCIKKMNFQDLNLQNYGASTTGQHEETDFNNVPPSSENCY